MATIANTDDAAVRTVASGGGMSATTTGAYDDADGGAVVPHATFPVYFRTLGGGGVRIGLKYVTRTHLEALFDLSGVEHDTIVIDGHGEEVVRDPRTDRYPRIDAFVDARVDMLGGDSSGAGGGDNSTRRQGGKPVMFTILSARDIDSDDDEHNVTDGATGATMPRADILRARLFALQRNIVAFIAAHYTRPRFVQLTFDDPSYVESMFDKDFFAAMRTYYADDARSVAPLTALLTSLTAGTRLFAFRFLSRAFASALKREVDSIEHESGLPLNRPNSMNRYGVILDEFPGYRAFFDTLVARYLLPLTAALYADVGGDTLDAHHAFIVQYRPDEDRRLDFHYDDAEVTLNVSLCDERGFKGSALYFRGILDEPDTHGEDFRFEHSFGVALLHRGKHRHGAEDIASGERSNLILWMRSSSYRAANGYCANCGVYHDGGAVHSHGHGHSH